MEASSLSDRDGWEHRWLLGLSRHANRILLRVSYGIKWFPMEVCFNSPRRAVQENDEEYCILHGFYKAPWPGDLMYVYMYNMI